MINTKLQSIIDTKSAIGNAITNKGGTVTSETPFFNYAAQIDGISTGTPQTIFQASDGSKWALTNAVNLVNNAGNVTYNFNWWQPANNSTSDPILNVGTVGFNLTTNVRIVPINQVSKTQYANITATDFNDVKYSFYNGYQFYTNPTPNLTGDIDFNRWIINNSATGNVLFTNFNTTVFSSFPFPNNSVGINQAYMPFVNNTAQVAQIHSIAVNNGFIYAGGFGNTTGNTIQKFNESTLAFVSESDNRGTQIVRGLRTNNGFVYVSDLRLEKYHESNLAFVSNSISGTSIINFAISNGFIYSIRQNNGGNRLGKFNESTLALVSESPELFISFIQSIHTNNGFVYVGGDPLSGTNRGVGKYHQSNLVLVGNTVNYGGQIRSITTNNGFIYVGGSSTDNTVQKFNESTLAFVGNTAAHSGTIANITTNNGFIYAGGFDSFPRTVKKYYESNLAFLGNTVNYRGGIYAITTNNGFIYVGGDSNQTVQKYVEQSNNLVETPIFAITQIKE